MKRRPHLHARPLQYTTKFGWRIEAKSGEDLQARANKVIDQFADVIARIQKILDD